MNTDFTEMSTGECEYCQAFLNNIGNYIRCFKKGTKIPFEDVYKGCAYCISKTMTLDEFRGMVVRLCRSGNATGLHCPFLVGFEKDGAGTQQPRWISF